MREAKTSSASRKTHSYRYPYTVAEICFLALLRLTITVARSLKVKLVRRGRCLHRACFSPMRRSYTLALKTFYWIFVLFRSTDYTQTLPKKSSRSISVIRLAKSSWKIFSTLVRGKFIFYQYLYFHKDIKANQLVRFCMINLSFFLSAGT